jgi:uncharacterized protein YkwD
MSRVRQIASASLVAVILAALVLWPGAPPGAATAGGPAQAAPAFWSDVVAARRAHGFARRLWRLQNAERRRHGLRRLKLSRDLKRAGRRHARDMVRRNYFGHVSHGGRTVVDRVASTRYGDRTGFKVQENLYWWNTGSSASAVLRAWMDSPAHRANVLNGGWRTFGVGVVMRSPYRRGGVTVAGVYGSRSRR